MNRKNRVCSAALSAVLTLTLVTAPAQALDTAGAERTEGDYAVMQAASLGSPCRVLRPVTKKDLIAPDQVLF